MSGSEEGTLPERLGKLVRTHKVSSSRGSLHRQVSFWWFSPRFLSAKIVAFRFLPYILMLEDLPEYKGQHSDYKEEAQDNQFKPTQKATGTGDNERNK